MKRRSDGRWQKKITLTDGHQKIFYSTAKTEKAAESDIQRKILEYTNDTHYNKHNFLRLAEEMLDVKEKTVSFYTFESYRHALKHLSDFYDMNIEDITPSMVQNLLNRMGTRNLSQSAIAKTKITFGLVLNYAILQNVPLNNFMPSIKLPKNLQKTKVPSATDDTISKITKNALTTDFGMWGMILLYTGMRRGELAAIQLKDIDFNNGIIHVWRSVEFINNQPVLKDMPKSISGVRDIPILDILKPLLLFHCKDLGDNDFIFGKTAPLTETKINKRWKKYCKEIDIDIHQHQLRHAYAKILYRAGIDPKTAQGLLGHADIQTTMNIYTEFSNDVTMKSVSKINSFLESNF